MVSTELTALVKQFINPEIHDALTKANYLYHVAEQQKKYVDGGVNIQVPIKVKANKAQGWIAGTGATVDANSYEQFRYMTFYWRYYYSNVAFTLEDITVAKNTKEAVKDFLQSKIDGAVSDAVRDITTALHTAQSGQAINSIVDAAYASGTAYGGLTDTDYDTGVFLANISTSTTAPTYSAMMPLIMAGKARCSQFGVREEQKLDTGLMNAATYGKFMAAAQAQQRFTPVKDLEMGFEGMQVSGINFYLDNNCAGTQDGTADSYVYVFPKAIMKLFFKYGWGNETSPFDGEIRIPNQPVLVNQTYFAGNFICTNRRLITVFKAVAA